MEAEKKAKELVDRFDETLTYLESKQKAKRCALIAVDEILDLDLHSVGDYKCFDDPSEWYISYWEQVKQEIEKL